RLAPEKEEFPARPDASSSDRQPHPAHPLLPRLRIDAQVEEGVWRYLHLLDGPSPDRFGERDQSSSANVCARRGQLCGSRIFRILQRRIGGSYGIVETNGQVWREQRRFALHTLCDLGLGKERMQEQILDEAAFLLSELESECKETGKVWPIKYLERTVGSVINLALFGYRFDKEHEDEFYKIRKL
ncbi:hypothetical protein PMAYCL1PPCAC_27141, partial [Pristionchus mayeri]